MHRCLFLALALLPLQAHAGETINYSYDAKGRLTQVAHSGTVNNGIVATYAFDKADNRTNVTVTGSAYSTPPHQVVVVPLVGLSVTTLPDP